MNDYLDDMNIDALTMEANELGYERSVTESGWTRWRDVFDGVPRVRSHETWSDNWRIVLSNTFLSGHGEAAAIRWLLRTDEARSRAVVRSHLIASIIANMRQEADQQEQQGSRLTSWSALREFADSMKGAI